MIRNKICSIFNPDQFQGWIRKRNYFEGWYFKVVNKAETRAFAFIPGIAMDENDKGHSFIQVFEGKKGTAKYHKFESDSFIPEPKRFQISIHDNQFSEQILQLDLPGMKGNLQFSGNIPWPNRWYSPGIMGPCTFLPYMECYHGIVSMDHTINGQLEMDGEFLNFDNGRGYIEKDWVNRFHVLMSGCNPIISVKQESHSRHR